MHLTPEIKKSHRRLGKINLRFLNFVRRNPECLDASQFAPPGTTDEEWLTYHLHPWPTLIDRDRDREAAEIAVGLDRLIRSLPERVFDRDPQRLADFHDLDLEDMKLALEHYSTTDHLISRGDYYDSPEGLKLLEMNFSSFLGGWQDAVWRPIYMRNRLIKRFFEEEEVRLSESLTTLQVFDHAARCAVAQDLHAEGELNLGVLLAEDNISKSFELDPSSFVVGAFVESLAQMDANLSGKVFIGRESDLTTRDGHVFLEGHRIHVLLQYLREWKLPPEVMASVKSGELLAINGAAQYPLRSKLNLALLSEMSDSPLFDAEEQALIQRHLPWSRKLIDVQTTFEGTEIHLPSWLQKNREKMILKHATSSQGEHVFLGKSMTPSAWEDLVQKALAEGEWLAQEFIEPLPYFYQNGENNGGAHDAVWGLFVCGGSYGGGFLRILPRISEEQPQVVNLDHGAARSPLFVVEEDD